MTAAIEKEREMRPVCATVPTLWWTPPDCLLPVYASVC